jgi:hypothetical protein
MEIAQKKITIYCPDKIYTGYMDIGNVSLRTIDVFNSSNIYWKDPAERSFDDAMLLYNATVLLEGNTKLGDYAKLQVKLQDIIFFYDHLENVGDSMEKKRAAHLKEKTKESASLAHIITHSQGHGFFYITGMFYGLFKSKSKSRYIPLTQATVVHVTRGSEKWQKKVIKIEGGFVGISARHIEACTFSSANI